MLDEAADGKTDQGRISGRRILVTGAHRSGTTALGALLAKLVGGAVLHEPLNLRNGLASVECWYQVLGPGDASRLASDLIRTTRGDWARWREPARFKGVPLVWLARSAAIAWTLRRRRSRPLIIKDPFLLTSLEFAERRLGAVPVVSIKHPAAWTFSLERAGWHPADVLDTLWDDERISSQLGGSFAHREWRKLSLIEAGAICWAQLHTLLRSQVSASDSRSILLPWESWAANPAAVLTTLVDQLSLPRSGDAGILLQELTGPQNPTLTHRGTGSIKRNSRLLVDAWRRSMPISDQRVVEKHCAAVMAAWYPSW